jgi:sulfur-oxidizing protein SoxZ
MANTIKAKAQVGAGGVATVKFIIQHPMLIERVDPKTGQTLPPHFIEEVKVSLRGEMLLEAAWGQAISVNPFFQFNYTGAKAGDEITISWRDNRGQSDTAQFPVS